jgi:hypothetical protein
MEKGPWNWLHPCSDETVFELANEKRAIFRLCPDSKYYSCELRICKLKKEDGCADHNRYYNP